MSTNGEKVVVAMSGGVDSSVAACLLVEQGYHVMGLFMRTGVKEPDGLTGSDGDVGAVQHDSRAADFSMRIDTEGESSRSSVESPRGRRKAAWPQPAARQTAASRHQGCCSASDAADARFVAGMLGIPFYVLNFEKDFDQLIDYFADEYAAGRTPNPCVVCNDKLKFGRLVEYADAVGAKFIATGHYARIRRDDAPVGNRCHTTTPVGNRCHTGSHRLLRGFDTRKDQSYVLFGLDRAILHRVMFPVGELEKPDVRRIADRFNLPNRAKPDSVEICFVPDRDYARVVQQRRPDAFAEGQVVSRSGEVLGKHRGIGHYTIGQRRGLGIAAGKPIYVTGINVDTNTVTMGDADALLHVALIAERAHFLVDMPDDSFRADVKIRYLHRAAPATVEVLRDPDGMTTPEVTTGGMTTRRAALPTSEPKVRIVFDEPQRAITPGQAVVFYDGDVVLGGAWIQHIADL